MYYPFGVKELSSPNELFEIALYFELSQAPPAFKELIKRLVVAQLEDNVDIILVLEGPLKLND